MDITLKFFALLRFSLGIDSIFEFTLSQEEWKHVFKISKDQALLGVIFQGVERLSKENAPDKSLLIHWFSLNLQIAKRNELLYAESSSVYNKIQALGYQACLLKGQGNAIAYQNQYCRMSGDIDIWVSSNRDELLNLSKCLFSDCDICFYHVSGKVASGVEVEIHLMPSIMNNYWYNRRLQKWFKENSQNQFDNSIDFPKGLGKCSIATSDFNVVFQLSHLYHHFFDEGIGLRQMTDFYYVISNYSGNKQKLIRTYKYLGLYHFAGAVMYLMQEIYALNEEDFLLPVDIKRGKQLLSEVLDGGNFGRNYTKYGQLTKQPMGKKYFLKIYRTLHFIKNYPAEAISEPIFRTWHFFWRSMTKIHV